MADRAQVPRVFVDFNNSDPRGRVRLNTLGTKQDLDRLALVLCEGMEILSYCLELEIEGVVSYSAEEQLWVAEIDWDNLRETPVSQREPSA